MKLLIYFFGKCYYLYINNYYKCGICGELFKKKIRIYGTIKRDKTENFQLN